MTERRSWFERPMASLFILAGITILSAYAILNSEARREGEADISCMITLRHYGIDAHEMEQTTAIPLEDALSAIPGIRGITSISENGQVRVSVIFRGRRKGASADEYYDAVREAAQRVYETLPASAQRPELSSSGDFRIPFWTAAVYSSSGDALPDGALLERIIKPALNSIEGIGEVEIAGPGIREIVITLDQEKIAALGLSPAGISALLSANDGLFSGGKLLYAGLEIPLHIDGRYRDLESLGDALIPLDTGTAVRLKTIAGIREQEREAETLSRLDGKRTAVVSVTASAGTDTGMLSNRIKKEMEKFSSLPLEFRVLADRGAEESAAFRSVLIASLEAAVLVALGTILLGRRKQAGFSSVLICAGAIPLISVLSAALLAAAGFPVNRKFLAGLTVGIGCAVDAVILSAEGFGRARNSRTGRSSEGAKILRGIWPPLVSGAVTTIAALLPLSGISGSEDITVISYALGIVTLVSLILALTLLPPLFLWEKK